MSADTPLRELDPSLVFPTTFGNEEERGLLIGKGKKLLEPVDLGMCMTSYLPQDIRSVRGFLTNGFKLYLGGGSDDGGNKVSLDTNIEVATPECGSPEELTLYINAGDELFNHVVEAYIEDMSIGSRRQLNARMQRRVVDSRGSRKGCHDSFGFHHGSDFAIEQMAAGNKRLRDVEDHLSTRSFMVGAGLVAGERLRYAQKIGGLTAIKSYGFLGSMYRDASQEDEAHNRFEIRCNDINISDWATRVRIGGSALVLAMHQLGLTKHLKIYEGGSILDRAKHMNVLKLNEEGGITPSKESWEAVDKQQAFAELAMDKIQLHTELPENYFWIANEIYRFCEDYRRVLRGEATIDLLADRADWAAKFSIILRRMEKDRQFGIDRQLGDAKSQAADMQYDHRRLTGVRGRLVKPATGLGFRWRDRDGFRYRVNPDQASAAVHRPPESRAAVRAEILSHFMVKTCNWGRVRIADADNDFTFSLDDPTRSTLSDRDQAVLSRFKRIR